MGREEGRWLRAGGERRTNASYRRIYKGTPVYPQTLTLFPKAGTPGSIISRHFKPIWLDPDSDPTNNDPT